ncbi:MAG: DUF2490 domain-containing protein [Myxococcales bacterium]|nr:DUF2490 domain-containing protein [Myxococcales bacterium]
MKTRALLLVCFFGSAAVRSARAETQTEHQIWVASIAQARLRPGSRVLGWFDLHDRRRDGATVLIVRPGVGYQVAERVSLHVGYAWIPTFVDEGANRHEHRSWQQLLWTLPAPAGWSFSLRPRLEQRVSLGSDDLGHRARLFVRGAWAPWAESPLLLAVWDELFFQFNDTSWGAQRGFDQNRVFVGLGAPALPGMRVEVGYLHVYLQREPDDQVNHNLAVNVFLAY